MSQYLRFSFYDSTVYKTKMNRSQHTFFVDEGNHIIIAIPTD